jgi:hypothetical protein
MAACMRHERISDALELLARYLTTFDYQLFKLQKASWEAGLAAAR